MLQKLVNEWEYMMNGRKNNIEARLIYLNCRIACKGQTLINIQLISH